MVAPSIATSTLGATGSGTSITVTAPTSISNGDLLVFVISFDGTAANPSVSNDGTGASWVREVYEDGSNQELAVFMKIAASETGDYTCNWTGNEGVVANCLRITGHLSSGYFELGTATNAGGNTSPSNAASMTPNTDNNLMLACHAIDRDRITSGQSDGGTGWTTLTCEESGGAGGSACAISTKTITTAAASSDSTFSLSTNDTFSTIQIAVRSEAPVAGGNTRSFGVIF